MQPSRPPMSMSMSTPMSTSTPIPTPASTPTAALLQPSAFLERMIRVLMPFFIDLCPDLETARLEIIETLASYGAHTRAQLLNATQIIAYGLSALDTLHEAKTTEMSASMRLRYRGCANNLNRSGQQNELTLAKRLAVETTATDDQSFTPEDEIAEAEMFQQLQEVHAKLAACGIHVPPPIPPSKPPAPDHPTRPGSAPMMPPFSKPGTPLHAP